MGRYLTMKVKLERGKSSWSRSRERLKELIVVLVHQEMPGTFRAYFERRALGHWRYDWLLVFLLQMDIDYSDLQ